MNIVITMAGLGSRFSRAGFKLPKYMIPVRGRTLFEWSMLSLSDFNQHPKTKYFFIVRKSDHSKKFITKRTSILGINNFQIIEIDHFTDGQATTALLAMPYCNQDDELIIYNIDTYVEPRVIKYADIVGDGFLPCFNALGTHWSFVKLDSSGKATEIREKSRISDNCTIGLYYFKSCLLYQDTYHKYYLNNHNLEKGEKYIAPLYNQMIKQDLNVRIKLLPSNTVHVLGTPQEVKAFQNK